MAGLSGFKISIAKETDFRSLSPIAVKAQETNPYQRLLYDRSQPQAAQVELELNEVSVWGAARSDNERIWRATIQKKGKERPVGFSIIRFKSQEEVRHEEEERGPMYVPEELNVPMIDHRREKFASLLHRHLNGLTYFFWDAIYVLPEYQRNGIGSELIRWGFEHFGLDRETICVSTTITEPFASYGFEQVDVLEMDLSEWGGEGLYRSYFMVRKPGMLQKSVTNEKTNQED